MRSEIGITVEAPPDLVFRLVRDVERWPALLPHYVSVSVERRDTDGGVVARFVARRPLGGPLLGPLGVGIPVAWRSRSWFDASDRVLRFRHLSGATRGMDVTWHFEPAGRAGCRVTIEHRFQPRLAPWAVVVERAFVRPIAGRTLTTFKSIAEAFAGASPSSPEAP